MAEQSKMALLVVDVQNGMFALPDNQPHNGDHLVTSINQLITGAREELCPVIFVQHDGGADRPLAVGSHGHKIYHKLEQQPDDTVIRKTQCGSFNGTKLLDTLKKSDIDHLVICGLQTEFCVDTAIRSAADHGFKITIAKDAHSTFNTETIMAAEIISHHERIWSSAFGTLMSTRDIFAAPYSD